MQITEQVRTDLKLLIADNLEYWQDYLESPCGDENCENHTSQLTIGLNDLGSVWSYQTGDNSFTGGAYCSPHWAVVYYSTETPPRDLYLDLMREIELMEVNNDNE